MFDRVALIGIGLMGSSLAQALRAYDLAAHISGCDSSAVTRARATKLGIVDQMEEDPALVVADADLVVLCTPVGAYGALAAAFGPAVKPGAIVTDVGSVKATMLPEVAPHLTKGVHLIPGHPVAGTESSGPDAGFAELFMDRWCILTPPPEANEAAVSRLSRMWQLVGSTVEVMSAAHHDKVLAITSHLPHLIAYTIVATADDLEGEFKQEHEDNGGVSKSEVIKFSAGGFRDFTRIAASDPIMWRDVFLANKDAVLEMLGRFDEDLTALQRAIRWGDGDALESLFTRTRAIRRGIVDAGQAGTFRAVEESRARDLGGEESD